MEFESFLKPRLIGPRFEGGAIPLHVLADLAVLEDMLIGVAKTKYRDATGRTRIPAGFMRGVSLELTGVETGSAIPRIRLAVALVAGLVPASLTYFVEAKTAIIGAIGAAEHGQPISDHLSPKMLSYFDRFGHSLRDGEAIEFTDQPAGQPAKQPVRLTPETRRKLVQASTVEEVENDAVLHGIIYELDHIARTFQMLLPDGTKVKAPASNQHYETVSEAHQNFKSGQRVRIYATARYNLANRIQSIESVDHMFTLDPLDIAVRIDELRQLKLGWLEGDGLPPSDAGLDWLLLMFEQYYTDDLPLPYLYPTPEGGVRAEWSSGPLEASLNIDLEKRGGAWHMLNVDTDEETVLSLALDESSGWALLATLLQQVVGGAA